MIIDKIVINKFRGFEDVEFDLGDYITVIAGQNGTQKTTILGMLSQPFSITDEDNPIINEKPLSGGSFKSAFSDKFKLSEEFDKKGEHEWTLHFKNGTDPYTVESIYRDKKSGTIRFWKKGTKEKGSGYIQFPVIFLSLKRLLPIGEDARLKSDNSIQLTDDEFAFYKKWHNKILILTRDEIVSSNYLSSANKQTLGATTEYYDWKQNSAGQDNVGKILLAILTFKRLKENYPDHYNGGILAIDEIDSTLYSGSQVYLLDALIRFAAQYNIQIIFTTHSLTLIEQSCKLQENTHRRNQVKVMFLQKVDNKIQIKNEIPFNFIKNHLNLTLSGKKSFKIDTFTEDREAAIFSKALLKGKKSKLKFIDVKLGCRNYIQLASKKIPSFTFPNSLIILDGDVGQSSQITNLKNVLILPGGKSPEQILADYLFNLEDQNELWGKIEENYSHQVCFKDYTLDEIQRDREKAKRWFNDNYEYWGTNATKVINPWIKNNKEIVDEFINNFVEVYNKFAENLGIKNL